jgi:hypothetical protein
MKIVDPTSVPVREFGRSPDDVDQLLRSFFQEEMPRSWPAFAGGLTPADQQPQLPAANRHQSPFRSRFVLAASVAILLIGTWWLGGRFSTPESPTSPSAPGKVIGAKERRNNATAPKMVPDAKLKKNSTSHSHP